MMAVTCFGTNGTNIGAQKTFVQTSPMNAAPYSVRMGLNSDNPLITGTSTR